jgi:hypothetical protein
VTLATPLALLALAVLIPLAVLHLRRPAPRRLTVASLLDWRGLDVGRPAERRRRFQLRPPLPLVLQALALGLLALGLARFAGSPSHRGASVVVVDDSLAMQTQLPSGGTRLALARRLAAARIAALPKGTRAIVVAASSTPHVVADSSDHARAVAALASLAPSNGPASFAPAAELGLARAGRAARTVTLLRAPEHPAPAGLSGSVVVGPSVPDRRVDLSARCPEGGGTCTLLARVTSDASGAAIRTVTVTVDGRQADRQFVRLRAHGETDLVAAIPPAAHVVSVTVAPQDALPADDTARVVLPDARPVRVALVAAANRLSAVRAAFAALPSGRVSQTTPKGLAAAARRADLLIVDRHAGLTGLPTRPAILLVDPRPGPGLPRGGTAQAPQVAGFDDASPLLADLDLTSLHVSELRRLHWPTWLEPLVTTPGGPLLLAGTHGAAHVAVLAFDPAGSNLSQLTGFPLLARNVVRFASSWLPSELRVGSATALPPGGTAITAAPAGSAAAAADGRVLLTAAPGVVTVRTAGGTRTGTLAVSAGAPAAERDIAARVAALPSAADRPRSWWPWVVAAGLAVLAAEWVVGTRPRRQREAVS